MRALWRLDGGKDSFDRPAAHKLEFLPEADDALQEFERWLEPRLGEGGELELLADWAGKLAGQAVRLAGILHVAGQLDPELAMGQQEVSLSVPLAPVEAAITLARDFFLPHARATLGLMGADQRLADAKRVAQRLPEFCEFVNSVKGVPPLSKQRIHATIFGGSRKAEEVEAAIELLVKMGYLLPAEQDRESRGRGRPAGQLYEVNPFALQT